MLIELALSLRAEAATLPVCPTCTYTTVGAAVNAAAAGDTVQIESGTYPISGSIAVSRAVTVRGRGAGVTTLTVPVSLGFSITTSSPVVIADLTLRGTGGAQAIDSGTTFNLTLNNVEATAFAGGCAGSVVDLNAGGSGLFAADGLDIHDNACRGLYIKGVQKPTTSGAPAQVYALVANSTFENNGDGMGDGGGVYVENSAIRFASCAFTGNHGARGGGLGVRSDPVAVVVEDSSFTANQADVGGGLNAVGGTGQKSYIEVHRSMFEGNVSNQGGAFEQSGAQTTIILDSTFIGNHSTTSGGAMYLASSSTRLTARRNLICGNSAAQYGGGVYLANTGSIASNNVFSNNRFVENDATQYGGGLATWSAAYDSRSDLFVGNTSPGGAGVRWFQGSAGVMRNAVVGQHVNHGLSVSGATGTTRYNAWYGNSPGNAEAWTLDASNLFTTPQFFAYTKNGDCADDDFRVPSTSPLVNAGDPIVTDLDGSRGDLSPWGGPDANPQWWTDGDGDGTRWVYDCDDTNASITGAQPWLADADGDGWGNPTTSKTACIAPIGYVAASKVDCNDASAAISPAATETCNGLDDDCDGVVDDNTLTLYLRDADGDSYGDVSISKSACTQPVGYTTAGGDCNDGNAIVHPNAPETCDALDRNCDGDAVQGATDAVTYRTDVDGDGYATASGASLSACSQPAGYSSKLGDCDDADALRFPTATEQCNLIDDDCDSSVDEGVVNVDWFTDGDSDGYGALGTPINDCKAPVGRVSNSLDCRDSDATIAPGVPERCDGVDQDCDAVIDDAAIDALVFYADGDGDGYGRSAPTATACVAPSGYAPDLGDCDDASAATHPGAPEDCASVDRDCDGQPSLGAIDTFTYLRDLDNDGYGDAADATDACTRPVGYVAASLPDCDDVRDDVNPGAPETCGDDLDSDCDGVGGPADDDDDDGIINDLEFTYGTDGCVTDSDGDHLSDAVEWGTDLSAPPLNTDGDSLVDAADADDDDDAISTSTEGTGDPDTDGVPNHLDDDSDGDGLLDFEEGTGDEDGDGTPNYLDPATAGTDSDADGLSDLFEAANGLDPFLGDSDDDGLSDGVEADETLGARDTDDDSMIDGLDDDDDGDGVPTRDEDLDGDGDWTNDDADEDGTPAWLDADEPAQDTGCDTGCDTGALDSDGDGIPDDVEGDDDVDGDGVPNRLDDDSDGDGSTDAAEGVGDFDGDGVPDWLDAGSVVRDDAPVPPILCGCRTSGAAGVWWLAAAAFASRVRRRRAT